MINKFFPANNPIHKPLVEPQIWGGETPEGWDNRPSVISTSDCYIYSYTVPVTGWYLIIASGANGSAGSYKDTDPGYRGGYGATICTRVWCKEGDKLRILPGRNGYTYNRVITATDGVSGAGGGASSVWRVISSISNSNYQFAKDGTLYNTENWECLVFAAGGCGTVDLVYNGQSSNRKNGADASLITVYTPDNVTSTTINTATSAGTSSTNTSKLGPKQVITYDGKGTYYTRGVSTAYGGFGCGSGSDDSAGTGGAWYTTGSSPNWVCSSFAYGDIIYKGLNSTSSTNSTIGEGTVVIYMVE